MSIIQKEDWNKMWIAKFDGWTLTLQGDQHVLGWLMIFPPEKFHGSFTLLSDEQLIQLKKIAIIAENLLKEVFNAEWFNYTQAGNHDGILHINVQPRYSSERIFENFTFKDENWGHLIKFLPDEELAPKEIVFKIVEFLRNKLKNKKFEGFEKVEICET